jgi:hypothetical protein
MEKAGKAEQILKKLARKSATKGGSGPRLKI